MRKEDMTVPALLSEAVMLVLGICYIGLQIFYGLTYHIAIEKFLLNVFAIVLVYIGITLLQCYPERVNRLSPEVFTPVIRKFTLRMLRLLKFVFVVGLLIPCVFDVFGVELQDAMSFFVIVLFLLIAGYYEYRIIVQLRNGKQ